MWTSSFPRWFSTLLAEYPISQSSNRANGSYSLADAQRKLAELGLYNSKVDGLPGPGTSHAISTFQHANGLPVTGQLDAATVSALQAR